MFQAQCYQLSFITLKNIIAGLMFCERTLTFSSDVMQDLTLSYRVQLIQGFIQFSYFHPFKGQLVAVASQYIAYLYVTYFFIFFSELYQRRYTCVILQIYLKGKQLLVIVQSNFKLQYDFPSFCVAFHKVRICS